MSSSSYKIRFRGFVKELSRKYELSIITSIDKTKKRTYEDSFGLREYDIERYGQEITADYFDTNVGHAVIVMG